MAHTNKTNGVLGVLLSLVWLAACSTPAPTSTPTPDLNPLRTQVAETVYAQVTQDLALTPSITPIPSPTATTLPTSTPLPAPSATPLLAASNTPGGTGNLTATASTTPPTPLASTDNRAQWVAQSIPDGTSFSPGETFTMTWRLKNVGTTTWTTSYLLRFFSGDAFGAPKEMPLIRDVPPGDTIDITLPMKAPARTGVYRSVWVMATEKRSNFKEPVFLQIIVLGTATPTITPTRTATPTKAP